jgi:outer membrane usher protein
MRNGNALNVAAFASLVLMLPTAAQAADSLAAVEFNSDFLQGGAGQRIDLARFARTSPVLPGDYFVDLDVNQEWVARVKVRFVAQPNTTNAEPCIDEVLLARLGVTDAAARMAMASGGCADLRSVAQGARVDYDQAALRLSVSIPQAMLSRRARGYVSPEFWDQGVPSATLAYDTSLFRSASAGTTTTSIYVGIAAGVNLGSWHFRQRSTISGVDGAWRFQNVAAYVQHDLPGMNASLTIGDAFTDGAVFDSFGFRGVLLATDDRMRPESQQGYAPIVRGIARTNARVRVTQNGSLLLETTVSPGPFEIGDLYPTGYGGDLQVTVLEADGAQQSFAVPYASLVQLLRPKTWRYSLAAGELSRGGSPSGDYFVQGAVQRGFTNSITGYAGAALAPGYTSALIGVAVNTPLGAFAVDATVAQARITAEDPDQGYSVRLSYSKVVPGILTNVSVAAYRHSSGGYWSMRDATGARAADREGRGFGSVQRQRNRFQINLSQDLGGGRGSLYLSGSATSYWGQANSVTHLQAGYNNVARLGKYNLNYGLSYSRQRDDATGKADDRMLLTLSAALGERANAPRLAVNIAREHERMNGQVSFGGTFGSGDAFSYNAGAVFSPGANSASLGGAYRAPFATLSASVSGGDRFTQFAAGASGGLVLHPGGVTLANQLGETIGIVSAPGAEGAIVSSGAGTRIDGRGYAVVPSLMPYRMNEVSINPEGIGPDVELKATSQQVAPRANSVVFLKFETATGQGVMIDGRMADGTAVPFGASIYDDQDAEIGITGQDGQIFLRGIPQTGTLQVKWGDTPDSRCNLDYRLLPVRRDNAAMFKTDAVCRPAGGTVLAAQPTPRIEALPI